MIPDAGIQPRVRAGGSATLNVSGASPVAGIRNRNGRPGVAPTIRGELRRGSGCRVATIAADSAGSVTTSGRACASRASSSNAPPQITSSSRRPSPPSLTERIELLRALEIGAQQLRCVAALHHAGRCGELAIHPHVERCAADTGLAEVVDADHRGEPRRGSLQVDGEIGVHIERDAVHVLDAAERELQRRWRRGLTGRGARRRIVA